MAMKDMCDELDSMLVDAAYCASDPVSSIGVSKVWLRHPRWAWFCYFLGFGTSPVVVNTKDVAFSTSFEWFDLYCREDDPCEDDPSDLDLNFVFDWGQLSPFGSAKFLSYELDRLCSLTESRNIQVPQRHDIDHAALALAANTLSLVCASVAFQCLAVIHYVSSLVFSIFGISAWMAAMAYHARTRSSTRLDCAFTSMLVLIVVALVRCVFMALNLT